MKYNVMFSKSAFKELEKLTQHTALRIVDKIEQYSLQPNPLVFAKKLTGTDAKYRFRIGSYRVIFEVNKLNQINILIILKIAHRKDVY